jgi:hypothetical protein
MVGIRVTKFFLAQLHRKGQPRPQIIVINVFFRYAALRITLAREKSIPDFADRNLVEKVHFRD